jgi:hypothetical protein
VNRLPKAEAIVWYLEFPVSEGHPRKSQDLHFSLARSLPVVGHPLVCVSVNFLGRV